MFFPKVCIRLGQTDLQKTYPSGTDGPTENRIRLGQTDLQKTVSVWDRRTTENLIRLGQTDLQKIVSAWDRRTTVGSSVPDEHEIIAVVYNSL